MQVLGEPLFTNKSPNHAATFDSARPRALVLDDPQNDPQDDHQPRKAARDALDNAVQELLDAALSLLCDAYTLTTTIPAHSTVTYPLPLSPGRTPPALMHR